VSALPSTQANPLKYAVAANLIGRAWAFLAVWIFVPFYLKFLGIEAYGLVGLFTTFQAVLLIADLGLSATLTRELARLAPRPDSASRMRNTLRSFELVFALIALLAALLAVLAAPLIAHHWIRAEKLSPAAVENALRLMGLAIALQFPATLYYGGLFGLQRQVPANILQIALSFLRGVGGVLILWLVSPTIQAFFLWYGLVNALQLLLTRRLIWRHLPGKALGARFDPEVFRDTWRYASALAGTALAGVLLLQVDKIVLSKLLPLATFGYYTLAWVVAQTPLTLSSSIHQAVLPRLTQLTSLQETEKLAAAYHCSSQTAALVIAPIAVLLALFPRELLFVWTGNPVTAAAVYPLLRLLAIGSGLMAFANLPYALQLAHGWAKLGMYQNIVAVLVLIPALIVLALRYGAVGACWVWIALGWGILLITVSIMHRRLLSAEQAAWYWNGVIKPLLATLAVGLLARALLPATLSRLVLAASLAGVLGVTGLIVLLISPAIRALVFHRFCRAPAQGNRL
jgi:O-antigen/teichoic acid export membrane protein